MEAKESFFTTFVFIVSLNVTFKQMRWQPYLFYWELNLNQTVKTPACVCERKGQDLTGPCSPSRCRSGGFLGAAATGS